MTPAIILASGSPIRATLLRNAGLSFETVIPRIDEDNLRRALVAEHATPRDIADALAEMKALRISERRPEALVIGCDQILEFAGNILAKPSSPDEARAQLLAMRGKQHKLLSAAVIYHGGAPLWRHVGQVRLTMRDFSDAFCDDYIARNWESLREAVGGYKLEEEGIRLFADIEGDYFNVLGLPLLPLLSYLTQRGTLPS